MPCGQFWRPIQRLCLTPVVLQLSQSLLGATVTVGTTSHRKKISTRFSDNPYFGTWTLHQDRRSLSSLLVQKSPALGSSRASMHRPTRRRCPSHTAAIPHMPPLSLSRRCLRAHDSFSGRRTSPHESPAADLLAYVPSFLIQHLHLHFFLCFVSDSYTFLGFLDFFDTQ